MEKKVKKWLDVLQPSSDQGRRQLKQLGLLANLLSDSPTILLVHEDYSRRQSVIIYMDTQKKYQA